MSMIPHVFTFEYVSGAILLPELGAESGRLRIHVVNVGRTDEVLRTLGYRLIYAAKASEKVFDSDIDFDPKTDSPDGNVAPNAVWRSEAIEFSDSAYYWVKILATSRDLVPSIDVLAFDRDTIRLSIARHYAPGDFAVFPRRATLVPGVPVPDDGELTRG